MKFQCYLFYNMMFIHIKCKISMTLNCWCVYISFWPKIRVAKISIYLKLSSCLYAFPKKRLCISNSKWKSYQNYYWLLCLPWSVGLRSFPCIISVAQEKWICEQSGPYTNKQKCHIQIKINFMSFLLQLFQVFCFHMWIQLLVSHPLILTISVCHLCAS